MVLSASVKNYVTTLSCCSDSPVSLEIILFRPFSSSWLVFLLWSSVCFLALTPELWVHVCSCWHQLLNLLPETILDLGRASKCIPYSNWGQRPICGQLPLISLRKLQFNHAASRCVRHPLWPQAGTLVEATLKTWKWTSRAHRYAWVLEGGCESRLSGLWGLLLYLWPWQFSKLNFQSNQCSARVQLRYLFIVGKAKKGNRAMRDWERAGYARWSGSFGELMPRVWNYCVSLWFCSTLF